MTRRLAPRLRWFVDHAATEDIKRDWVDADRELRALLAVARVVGRMKARAFDGDWQALAEDAFAAHDRLDRLSAGPGAAPRRRRT